MKVAEAASGDSAEKKPKSLDGIWEFPKIWAPILGSLHDGSSMGGPH